MKHKKLKFEDRIIEIKSEIKNLEKEIEEARQSVDEEMLRTYDRVKKVVSKPPYMAPLKDQKCSGCNLRVSNDVFSTALLNKSLHNAINVEELFILKDK